MYMKIALVLVAALAVQGRQSSTQGVRVTKLRERMHGKPLATKPVVGLIMQAMNKQALPATGMTFKVVNDRMKHQTRVLHMQQLFEGIEVFGYGATVQDVTSHKMTVMNGEYVEGLETVAQKGDAQKLQRRAWATLMKVKAAHPKGQTTKNDDDISLPDKATPIIYVNGDKAVKGYLVQFVDRYSTQPSYPNYIVDADGKVLEQFEGLNTEDVFATGPGGNEKIGRIDHTEIPADKSGSLCKFDTDNVRTIDLMNSFSNRKTTAHSFDCFENTVREVNGGFAPMNDAQFFGTKIFDYYSELYDTSPLERTPLLLKVHYRRGYENAFFDGNSMTFGDGASFFYPLTSLDVVAHEVAHGVTDQSSQLIYRGQSGGLNEAFSDMSGKAVERFVRGFEGTTFGIGIDITKGSNPLRFMDDPPRDGRSIDHVRDYRTGLDVHFSSGIYNKVFFLMATNPNFVNDIQDTYDIFYTANTMFWGRSTGFTAGAELTLQATEDLIAGMHLPRDLSHIDIEVVKDAFRTVGVDCTGSNGNFDCTELD